MGAPTECPLAVLTRFGMLAQNSKHVAVCGYVGADAVVGLSPMLSAHCPP